MDKLTPDFSWTNEETKRAFRNAVRLVDWVEKSLFRSASREISYRRRDLKSDWKGKRHDFGVEFKNIEEFKAYAREALRGSDEVMFQLYTNWDGTKEPQLLFFNRKLGLFLAVDEQQRISSISQSNDIEKTIKAYGKIERTIWLRKAG